MRDLKEYTIEEAIKKIKETKKEKFDSTVELHINLDIDPKKTDQSVRFSTSLPHGTGKTKRVAVLASAKVDNADLELTEADLDRIEKGELRPKIDFDVFVSESRFMPKIAKVAKILGPAGMMPNPKTGTVSDDPKKAIELIKKGKVDIKTEKDMPIIHTIIGKTSFEEKALVENFKEVMNNLKQNRPQKVSPEWIKSVYLTSTMGGSVKVQLASL
jgi:large subunit ribosomal protein L1